MKACCLQGMSSVFFNKGENCIAAGRLFVEDSIHDQFVQKVVSSDCARSTGALGQQQGLVGFKEGRQASGGHHDLGWGFWEACCTKSPLVQQE